MNKRMKCYPRSTQAHSRESTDISSSTLNGVECDLGREGQNCGPREKKGLWGRVSSALSGHFLIIVFWRSRDQGHTYSPLAFILGSFLSLFWSYLGFPSPEEPASSTIGGENGCVIELCISIQNFTYMKFSLSRVMRYRDLRVPVDSPTETLEDTFSVLFLVLRIFEKRDSD